MSDCFINNFEGKKIEFITIVINEMQFHFGLCFFQEKTTHLVSSKLHHKFSFFFSEVSLFCIVNCYNQMNCKLRFFYPEN